jgi:hypothetical protein
MSSGLWVMSYYANKFHKLILEQHLQSKINTKLTGKYEIFKNYTLLSHNSKKVMANSFVEAFKIYNNPEAQVLFIINDIEYNIYD